MPHLHNTFMQRALQLAANGRGSVSPNPMVGCVVVHQNKIIGEGWHRQYGQAHAEVNAIEAVADKSLLKTATAYVTLEPCSHFGKTPPCADLLIKHQLQRVVVCNLDPNPLVAGTGILKLKNAGIEVITGVLEQTGRNLNRRFFMAMEHQRPYVILKYAQTADGFMAGLGFEQIQISNVFSKQLLHQWRAQEDAIMVGFNTALHDNPRLTVRNWQGKNPTRVLLDMYLKLPKHLHVFDNEANSVFYNSLKTEQLNATTSLQKIDNQANILSEILQDLCRRKVHSLLVEGGPKTLQAFIDADLFDEIRIFEAKKTIKKGIKAPTLPAHLTFETQQIHDDALKTAFNLKRLV